MERCCVPDVGSQPGQPAGIAPCTVAAWISVVQLYCVHLPCWHSVAKDTWSCAICRSLPVRNPCRWSSSSGAPLPLRLFSCQGAELAYRSGSIGEAGGLFSSWCSGLLRPDAINWARAVVADWWPRSSRVSAACQPTCDSCPIDRRTDHVKQTSRNTTGAISFTACGRTCAVISSRAR